MAESDRRTTFPGETGSWSRSEEQVPTVLARVAEATKVLSGWVDAPMEADVAFGGGAGLPMGAVDDLARAYALLQHAERYIPDVMGWGVGYWWGTDMRSWSCFSAHTDVEEAERFRVAWEAKSNRQRDNWIVRLCPCSITKFIRPDTDAERYVAESGAFN